MPQVKAKRGTRHHLPPRKRKNPQNLERNTPHGSLRCNFKKERLAHRKEFHERKKKSRDRFLEEGRRTKRRKILKRNDTRLGKRGVLAAPVPRKLQERLKRKKSANQKS